jgi:hypothetical protein
VPFRLFSKILEDIRNSRSTAGAVYTGGKFIARIIVTRGKFTADVNDTGGLPELTNIFASLEKN